jgi:hypothetical protein
MAQMAERNKILWGINMDVDELFAFGPNTAATPGCLDPQLSRNGIGKFLALVPGETVAVVVPQIMFGTSNHIMVPLTTQAEAHTRRGRFSKPPKIIVCAGALVPELSENSHLMYPEDSLLRMYSKHSIQVKLLTIDSVIVMNSFGGLAEYAKASNYNIKCNPTSAGLTLSAWCTIASNGLSNELIFNSLHLHHYTSQSTKECQSKMNVSYVQNTWRNIPSNHAICSNPGEVNDYSISCAGKVEREYCIMLFHAT